MGIDDSEGISTLSIQHLFDTSVFMNYVRGQMYFMSNFHGRGTSRVEAVVRSLLRGIFRDSNVAPRFARFWQPAKLRKIIISDVTKPSTEEITSVTYFTILSIPSAAPGRVAVARGEVLQ